MTPVGLAATAATSAVAAGLATVTAAVLGVRATQPPGTGGAEAVSAAAAPAAAVPTVGLPFYLLVFGTLGGIVIAGIVAWTLLGPLGSTYRRGGLALVAAFATVMAMLVCIPVEQLLGKPGLLGLFAVCAAASLLLARRARGAVVSPAE